MRKIAAYILVAAALAVLILSTWREGMNYVHETRNESDAWWGAVRGDKGDLVNMGYLDNVTRFSTPRIYNFRRPAFSGKDSTNLYLYGDSYTFLVPDSAFAGVSSYQFAWRGIHEISYKLDTSKRNVLVIEVAERYIREQFNSAGIFDKVHAEQAATVPQNGQPQEHKSVLQLVGEKYSYAESQVFNPFINQNIEFNLFEYNFISAVRKVKGMLTYKLFNRASGDVVISDDGSQLYLKETVDDKNTKSAFNPVDDSEIENIVQTLNAISQHYKAEGFDQVYFSMIPNPVTAIEPDNKYNHIIARIENNPVLEINTISVLNDFSKAGKSVYRPGDTHWNDSGMQMWLRKVNESLNAR